jgi:hypothetical protein
MGEPPRQTTTTASSHPRYFAFAQRIHHRDMRPSSAFGSSEDYSPAAMAVNSIPWGVCVCYVEVARLRRAGYCLFRLDCLSRQSAVYRPREERGRTADFLRVAEKVRAVPEMGRPQLVSEWQAQFGTSLLPPTRASPSESRNRRFLQLAGPENMRSAGSDGRHVALTGKKNVSNGRKYPRILPLLAESGMPSHFAGKEWRRVGDSNPR